MKTYYIKLKYHIHLKFQEQFWQCFLVSEVSPVSNSAEVSRIDRVGMDSAKWHCCQRANSSHCSRLCAKTFTKFWSTSWDEFRFKCLNQPTEESLKTCIDEGNNINANFRTLSQISVEILFYSFLHLHKI